MILCGKVSCDLVPLGKNTTADTACHNVIIALVLSLHRYFRRTDRQNIFDLLICQNVRRTYALPSKCHILRIPPYCGIHGSPSRGVSEVLQSRTTISLLIKSNTNPRTSAKYGRGKGSFPIRYGRYVNNEHICTSSA